MEMLKYKVIKTDAQYFEYCDLLEALIGGTEKNSFVEDEIDLLSVLIEQYDAQHQSLKDADPIVLLKSLMKDHKLKSVDLARLLGVSEGLVSDMLNYKKGLSKDTIRIVSDKFGLRQEAFNRPYKLIAPDKAV
jgi:HTH-type transcriptional regulator/antitoxin HigA